MIPNAATHSTDCKCVYSIPFKIRGSLIDFETTGIPRRDQSHEIVTLGILQSDTVTICQRASSDRNSFYEHVREVLKGLPRPLYSYNADFEKLVIRAELGLEVQDAEFVDLMAPWKRKAENLGLKWPRLGELVSEPEDYFQAEKVSGKDIPALWKEFIFSPGTEEPLEKIMEHCFSDIIREATLLLRYPY